jgi:hypothetical protein
MNAGGRPRGSGLKRFCVNGHDTFVVGRHKASYACKACNQGHQIRKRARLDAGRLPALYLLRTMRKLGVLVEDLGVSGSTMKRWKSDGIPYMSADEYACQLGLHPSQVWPDWWVYTDMAIKAERREDVA